MTRRIVWVPPPTNCISSPPASVSLLAAPWGDATPRALSARPETAPRGGMVRVSGDDGEWLVKMTLRGRSV